jgi:DNA-binding transcriptional LysR family regulator
VLREYLTRFPDVEVSLEVTNRAVARGALAEASVDLAIMGRPPAGLAVEVRPFAVNRLHLVCAPFHPLAAEHQHLEIWEKTTLLVREEGSGSRAATEEALAELGLRSGRKTVLGSNAALLAAVGQGLGMAVLPEIAVAADLATGSLVRIPAPGFPIQREWQAVWPTSRPLSRPAVAFLDHLVREGGRLIEEAANAVGLNSSSQVSSGDEQSLSRGVSPPR